MPWEQWRRRESNPGPRPLGKGVYERSPRINLTPVGSAGRRTWGQTHKVSPVGASLRRGTSPLVNADCTPRAQGARAFVA